MGGRELKDPAKLGCSYGDSKSNIGLREIKTFGRKLRKQRSDNSKGEEKHREIKKRKNVRHYVLIRANAGVAGGALVSDHLGGL